MVRRVKEAPLGFRAFAIDVVLMAGCVGANSRFSGGHQRQPRGAAIASIEPRAEQTATPTVPSPSLTALGGNLAKLAMSPPPAGRRARVVASLHLRHSVGSREVRDGLAGVIEDARDHLHRQLHHRRLVGSVGCVTSLSSR